MNEFSTCMIQCASFTAEPTWLDSSLIWFDAFQCTTDTISFGSSQIRFNTLRFANDPIRFGSATIGFDSVSADQIWIFKFTTDPLWFDSAPMTYDILLCTIDPVNFGWSQIRFAALRFAIWCSSIQHWYDSVYFYSLLIRYDSVHLWYDSIQFISLLIQFRTFLHCLYFFLRISTKLILSPNLLPHDTVSGIIPLDRFSDFNQVLFTHPVARTTLYNTRLWQGSILGLLKDHWRVLKYVNTPGTAVFSYL